MSDKELEQKKKFKTLAIVFGVGVVFTLIASWYATQNVAELCGYSELLGFNIAHIYLPWQYFIWCNNPDLQRVIPQILSAQEKWFYIALLPLIPIGYLVQKSMTVNTSHGSAGWALKEDIDDSGLGLYETDPKKMVIEKRKLFGIIPYTKKYMPIKNSGVVVGINPYTNKIMLHDGPEHILVMAPTRSGKGVNTIIPTGLIWQHSIFFFDVKKELWQATGAYRRKVLGQKVMKFEPLCPDGSTARWNPLAEIDFQTTREISDISTIVEIMVRPDGKKSGGDDFWPDSAAALLKGVILHLLYSHYQEGKPIPCPTDIMSFLSSPDKSTTDLFRSMKEYPHISPEDFMSDHNVLYDIYGEYIRDWRVFNQQLSKWHHAPVHSIAEIKAAINEYREKSHKDIAWGDPPWMNLLSHPKVAEAAANMLNGAEQTRASIMQTAQTALALYQNPVVQKNTAVSDFTVRDLLNPAQAVSLYLCMEVDDVATVKPLSRLFINTILSKLIRNMKFDVNQVNGAGKQRLLLMLDEFPQLGNMSKIELALAVCAGYGIKMCIVSQDVNQLNKEYTKDNSISSNCHVHIYFTPNLDNGGATAKAISESLGKHTISTTSHSTGSGGWFSGSDSTSFTGRELMTPDEVSRMSPEEELVFIAGHKPIHGKKLRYYLFPWFTKRIMPELLYSDACTSIFSYADLFRVHEAERRELEERISEVKEEKAHMLLDSAQNEKLQADQAVEEAKAKLESLMKEINPEKMGKEARIQLETAKSQLAIAENASGLAKAHIDIYHARLQLISLERMISQIQAEKDSSTLSDTFMTADMKLKQAQADYNNAKAKLADAIKKEEQVQKTINAENRRIKARMNLMAALDQLESTSKDAETIFREAEERRNLGNSDKAELAQREISAKTMLDIAMAAKESAEQEFFEAKAAYKAIVDAIQKDREDAQKEDISNEQSNVDSSVPAPVQSASDNDDGSGGNPRAGVVPPSMPPSAEVISDKPTGSSDNNENVAPDFEDMDDDWESQVWGSDPTENEDEDDEDVNIDSLYEQEEDDTNGGSNNTIEAGNGGEQVSEQEPSTTENDQHSGSVDVNNKEAAFDGPRGTSEESRQAVVDGASATSEEQREEKDNATDDNDSSNGGGGGQVAERRVDDVFVQPVVTGNLEASGSLDSIKSAIPTHSERFSSAGGRYNSISEKSWPSIRLQNRLKRQEIMAIQRQQFGQGRI